MPLLYVYDAVNGLPNLVTTVSATSVSPDGSEATFPFPNLPQNGYSLAVQNRIPETPGDTPAGTNVLSVASSQTIAGNPFGVAASGLTDKNTFCKPLPPRGQQYSCTTTTTYSAFPVVSLFGQNQVLIQGRTAINVGSNPTAVATYPAGPVTEVFGNVTDVYTGTTRAVVANSGGNTVSILDTVNNVVVSNVTVGSHPVALVVSSDGSTAYVANYSDSTVTRVNLNTATPAGTVAVGGKPTSVALTASGTLWVGGVGFLTQINTQNLSVVATESSSRTISALAYTDAYNEIIATSSDSSGNVYVDSIGPSSVTAGGVYTPLVSSLVSALGTYLNPRTQAEVRGYTGSVTTGSVPINTNQAGAPPLVVQDGWLVVSATPTGFSVTNAASNQVLISQTTPSPVAAIAVDTKLNAAYLTMPDSNTLLTVPLPGIGSN